MAGEILLIEKGEHLGGAVDYLLVIFVLLLVGGPNKFLFFFFNTGWGRRNTQFVSWSEEEREAQLVAGSNYISHY